MNTVYFPHTTPLQGPYAATIGCFDGLHRGHQYLIDHLCQWAQKSGQRSMVITFERHPREVLCPEWRPQLLTTLEEKKRLLAQTGIDSLVVLRFDQQMARWGAREFMEQVLLRQLGVTTLLTGYDNRFGHDRSEGFEQYEAYGRSMGMQVVCADALCSGEGLSISSTRVRQLLTKGHIAEANACLGHLYTLTGIVEHGEQIGRKIGFPTANMMLPTDSCKLVPADGAYAVSVSEELGSSTHSAILNIGTRPTFAGHRRTIEAHLLDYSGNLYGHTLTLHFVARLRDEQAFESAEALAKQLQADAQQARLLLSGGRDGLDAPIAQKL